MIVLLVHNPSSDTSRLSAAFQRRGHEVVTVETVAEATARLKRGLPDVAVVPVSESLVELVDAARPKIGRFCYLMRSCRSTTRSCVRRRPTPASTRS